MGIKLCEVQQYMSVLDVSFSLTSIVESRHNNDGARQRVELLIIRHTQADGSFAAGSHRSTNDHRQRSRTKSLLSV